MMYNLDWNLVGGVMSGPELHKLQELQKLKEFLHVFFPVFQWNETQLKRNWLVVSTHLKNMSQIGSFPQGGVNIKNIWNHHPGNSKTQNLTTRNVANQPLSQPQSRTKALNGPQHPWRTAQNFSPTSGSQCDSKVTVDGWKKSQGQPPFGWCLKPCK